MFRSVSLHHRRDPHKVLVRLAHRLRHVRFATAVILPIAAERRRPIIIGDRRLQSCDVRTMVPKELDYLVSVPEALSSLLLCRLACGV